MAETLLRTQISQFMHLSIETKDELDVNVAWHTEENLFCYLRGLQLFAFHDPAPD